MYVCMYVRARVPSLYNVNQLDDNFFHRISFYRIDFDESDIIVGQFFFFSYSAPRQRGCKAGAILKLYRLLSTVAYPLYQYQANYVDHHFHRWRYRQ